MKIKNHLNRFPSIYATTISQSKIQPFRIPKIKLLLLAIYILICPEDLRIPQWTFASHRRFRIAGRRIKILAVIRGAKARVLLAWPTSDAFFLFTANAARDNNPLDYRQRYRTLIDEADIHEIGSLVTGVVYIYVYSATAAGPLGGSRL